MAAALLCVAPLLACGNALAQERRVIVDGVRGPSDEEIQYMRKDVRSAKKQIVAANMILTDTEAERFWPVYERFTDELIQLSDRKVALIKEYAKNYSTLTNDQAASYLDEQAAIEESAIQLRRKYIPIFRKALSGKSTALFFQIEWRLNLMIELQLASEIPVIEAN